jgi:hypothetical protein
MPYNQENKDKIHCVCVAPLAGEQYICGLPTKDSFGRKPIGRVYGLTLGSSMIADRCVILNATEHGWSLSVMATNVAIWFTFTMQKSHCHHQIRPLSFCRSSAATPEALGVSL